MNTTLEAGFVAILESVFPELPFRQATSKEPFPSNQQLILVECREVEHVAGPLHKATLRVLLVTPAFDYPETAHRDSSARLALPFEMIADPALLFAQKAGENLALRGLHIRSLTSDILDDHGD